MMSLKKLFIISILIHLIASVFSTGFYHKDEHFQILEFSAMKLKLTPSECIAWEYHHQMRPAIQPAIAYGVVKTFQWIGFDNPFYETIFLRMISAILSFICIYMLLLVFVREIHQEWLKKWFIFLSLFLWMLVYQHVRFSSESWSGSFFFIGLGLYFYFLDKQIINSLTLFITGVIIGFSFIIRFQTGFMIGGFLLWLLIVRREKYLNLSFLILGLFVSFSIGLLFDYWLYERWVLTAWHYLNINIIQDKVSSFGLDPWWYYIYKTFIIAIPPYSILLIGSFFTIWIFYPKNVISWVILPFLIIHTLIGHKEIRFLIPIVNTIPIVIILVLQKVIEDKRLSGIKYYFDRFSWKWFYRSFLVINVILLMVICLKPSDRMINFYKYVYDNNYSKLYFMGKNPYRYYTICKNFYKRKTLNVIEIQDLSELKNYVDGSKEKLFFVVDKFNINNELSETKLKYKLIFRNLPEWSTHFNINNWLKRTKVLSLYEIDP